MLCPGLFGLRLNIDASLLVYLFPDTLWYGIYVKYICMYLKVGPTSNDSNTTRVLPDETGPIGVVSMLELLL